MYGLKLQVSCLLLYVIMNILTLYTLKVINIYPEFEQTRAHKPAEAPMTTEDINVNLFQITISDQLSYLEDKKWIVRGY